MSSKDSLLLLRHPAFILRNQPTPAMKTDTKVRGPILPHYLFPTLAAVFTLLHMCAVAQLPMTLGDLDADRVPTVVDLQQLLNHINSPQLSTPSLSASLLPYADINEDGFVNTNDVFLLQDAILGRSTLPNPYAVPVVNISTTATNGDTVTITGTARPNRRIMITGGQLVVFASSGTNGQFTAQVRLRRNQVNALFVTATNATFTAGIPQPLRVLQDSQSPNLFIDFPTNGTTLHSESTVIAGRVGDSLSGFAGLNVRVRSVESQVEFPAVVDVGIGNNGTYERSNVPLVEGTNTIRVTATDVHGNATNREITIIRRPLEGPRLLALFGDGQKTNVHRRLSDAIVVKATQADGVTPLANTLVTFEVTRSDGRLQPLSPAALADPAAFTNDINRTPFGVPRVTLRTDAAGTARVWWALGGDAGCGNNRVCVMSAGISNAVYFCASADPAPPKQINIGTGNNQKAETGGFLPEPLRAWVNDSCNGNQDMPVTFTVIQGGGKLVAADVSPLTNSPPGGDQSRLTSAATVLTTRTGHAEVLFQLGPDAGQNIIEANYPNNPNLPATFIAYGVARDASKPTTLTGLLLDNTSQPIGGATCRLSVGGRSFTNTTDIQGRFVFGPSTINSNEPSTLPSGPAQLRVDGTSANTLLGVTIPTNSYPSLEFQLILIPNAENSLPSPVLLPKLNLANQRLYYGTNDLVLTCEGMEGLKMTIKAGSMKKPDGTLVTPSNPSFVSLNQVHHDNVPMPIPDGASPPFAWTLQPGGSTFDPPIQIEYPNMSGLPAGTIAYFLSYNHDTRRFEIICSGHVREDSATIVSDPGAGLSIAGWGCNCPPYSVTGDCENICPIQRAAPQRSVLADSESDRMRCMQIQNEINILNSEAKRRLNLGRSQLASIDPFEWASPAAMLLAIAKLPEIVGLARVAPISTEDKVKIGAYVFSAIGTYNRFKSFVDKYFSAFSHYDAAGATAETSLKAYVRGKLLCSCWIPLRNIAEEQLREAKLDIEFLKETGKDAAINNAIEGSFRLGDILIQLGRLIGPILPIQPIQLNANAAEIQEDEQILALLMLASSSSEMLTNGLSRAEMLMVNSGRTKIEQASYIFEEVIPTLQPETWSFGVGGQIRAIQDSGSLLLENISAPDQFGNAEGPGSRPDFVSDDYVRLIGQSTAGGTNRYAFSEFFQIRQGQTTFINDLTFTDVPPRKPESLTIVCTNRILRVGEPRQLEVLARFADGSTTNVAAKTSWTSYRVSNPAIATVSSDGVVTPLKPGVVYVTAANEGATAVCGLNVVGGNDGLTIVTGTVVDTNGMPVAGATVRIYDLLVDTVITDASGNFTIPNVPTTLDPITAEARWFVNGRYYIAIAKVVGNSDGTTALGPVTLRPLTFSTNYRFAASGSHTVALQANSSLWAWGYNGAGQLGDGTTANRLSPMPVWTNLTWAAVSVGMDHTLALTTDGSLWVWGYNSDGQLGDGTTTNRLSPVPVGMNHTWAAVSAGDFHTIALATNGSLWAWGWNADGKLGDGTTVTRLSPVSVGTNRTWTALSAGGAHTLALATDGSLWAWGANYNGQLGDGTTTNRRSPVPVGSNRTWIAVSAGGAHTLALATDGSLWAWGGNAFSELGDGTTTNRLSPVPVGTNHTWAAVSAGDFHTIALATNGSLWAWGWNIHGQLGNGTTTTTNTPQPVLGGAVWGR